jgi:hypothetical protein
VGKEGKKKDPGGKKQKKKKKKKKKRDGKLKADGKRQIARG